MLLLLPESCYASVMVFTALVFLSCVLQNPELTTTWILLDNSTPPFVLNKLRFFLLELYQRTPNSRQRHCLEFELSEQKKLHIL